MKKSLIVLPILAVMACGSSMGGSSEITTEVQSFRMADEIAQSCGRYATTMSADDFYSSISQNLTSNGSTAQEAQDMITQARESSLDGFRQELLSSLNVASDAQMSYCALGDRARAARPDVGDFLMPVNPSS